MRIATSTFVALLKFEKSLTKASLLQFICRGDFFLRIVSVEGIDAENGVTFEVPIENEDNESCNFFVVPSDSFKSLASAKGLPEFIEIAPTEAGLLINGVLCPLSTTNLPQMNFEVDENTLPTQLEKIDKVKYKALKNLTKSLSRDKTSVYKNIIINRDKVIALNGEILSWAEWTDYDLSNLVLSKVNYELFINLLVTSEELNLFLFDGYLLLEGLYKESIDFTYFIRTISDEVTDTSSIINTTFINEVVIEPTESLVNIIKNNFSLKSIVRLTFETSQIKVESLDSNYSSIIATNYSLSQSYSFLFTANNLLIGLSNMSDETKFSFDDKSWIKLESDNNGSLLFKIEENT